MRAATNTWPSNVYTLAADLIEAEGWRADFTGNVGFTTGEAIHQASIDLGVHGANTENCRRAMQAFARWLGVGSLSDIDSMSGRSAADVAADLRAVAASKAAAA